MAGSNLTKWKDTTAEAENGQNPEVWYLDDYLWDDILTCWMLTCVMLSDIPSITKFHDLLGVSFRCWLPM